MQKIDVMVLWAYESFIAVFICLHSFSPYSTCCYTNTAEFYFCLYTDLRHKTEEWLGKPGSLLSCLLGALSFRCLGSWKGYIKTGLLSPSASASLWYLCGILYRFPSQGHHFVTSGLDLEKMGLAMDSIQGSTVPGVWTCLAAMSLCRKATDLVTRVPWSRKSHLPPLHTQDIAKIHMGFTLLKSLGCLVVPPNRIILIYNKKQFFFPKKSKWSSKINQDLLLMSDLQREVAPAKLCFQERHPNNQLVVSIFQWGGWS